MKKIPIILCLAVLLGGMARAQNYGDTVDIRIKQPGFYYSGWWTNHEMDTVNLYKNSRLLSRPIYRYHYSDVPLRVKGIAAVILNTQPLSETPFYDSTYAPEYLMLCDATPNSFDTVKSVLVNVSDSHMYAKIPYDSYSTCCGSTAQPSIEYFPLYTFYFDTPVVVYDSFYVGATNNSVLRFYEEHPISDFLIFRIGMYQNIMSSCADPCYELYEKDFFYSIVVDRWTWSASIGSMRYEEGYGKYLMIYPIAVPDTCPLIEGFRAMDAGCGEGVKLVWDPSDRPGGWEVAYGPAGTPPDSCTVVPCDEPLLVLDSCIEAGVHYVAYVRKVCGNKVIQYYSEWSDGVEVCRTNRYTVVAEANIADRGQVEGSGEYCEGDEAVLTAQPQPSFHFLRWNDGNTTNPRHFVVTQDTAFTALFVIRTGIEDAEPDGSGFRLLPNPAGESVSCVLLDDGGWGGTIVVRDALGREVLRQLAPPQVHSVELSVAHLPQGIYMVSVTTERGTKTKKLVVEH